MAITQGKRACSVCGTLLPDDSAPCPVCALRLAPETRSDSAPAAKAFISHSSKDEGIAEAICQHLESAGVPCWIAPRDIEPGADWTEGILHGIAGSRIFVLVFSSHANDSEHVRREVGKAFSLHLPVLPFRTEAIEPRDSLGYFLESVQWLDATKPPLERYLPVLTQRVKALLSGEQARPHETAPANEPRQIPNRAPRRKRWLPVTALIGAAAVVAAGLWFFVANWHKTNESNPIPASAAIPAKSIAVLPFESLSENKSDAYFADGVQDEILNNLAKIAELKVISRTSVMQYRGDNKRDLRQVANALGVANVLEGTVRREGNHVRVSTELVDARNDTTIWADSYDRDLTDIFAIQRGIAQQVASRLRAQLSPEERKDIDKQPTNNLEAYDLYLQAKQLANAVVLLKSTKENFTKAISLLEQATAKDPQFSLAYCMIANAQDGLSVIDPTPERRTLAEAAVNEAFRLRPDLPEAHLAMALHLYYYGDFERARVQLAIAAQALPNNPDVLQVTAAIDQVQGHWEKATAGLERAASLDPRNPDILSDLADNYVCLRRYRDSERILDGLIALEPDQPIFPLQKAFCAFLEKADLRGARIAYEAVAPSIKDDAGVIFHRMYLALCARDFAAAEEIVSKTSNEEIIWNGSLVPGQIITLWIELFKGNHPTMEQFRAAREQLERKVQADPNDPYLLADLALADIALGRKEGGIQEGRRVLEMRPISEDAFQGPHLAMRVAVLYAWANQPELAFEQLDILIKIPGGLTYGDLKTYPGWDPLRKDPRFDKLLAELAPRD